MSERPKFASFLAKSMNAKKLDVKTLSEFSGCSSRTVYQMLSGQWEQSIEPYSRCSASFRRSSTLARVLTALDEESSPWQKELRLPPVAIESVTTKAQEGRLKQILREPVTTEDLEWFCRTQRELGEMFTLEMAARLLEKKRRQT